MALLPDQKFSTFSSGGQLETTDIIVGLRNGINTRFTMTNPLPVGYVVPIALGGTAATTAANARTNLGLGTIAVQDASTVAITGGTIAGVAITSSSAVLTTGQVAAAPVSGNDITNKTYVDSMVGGSVASVSGTLNRITSTGGVNPVIDISASYVGQASITTLGTIATGTWQGNIVGIGFGGTGVSSVTTAPTVTAFAGWDANRNLSAINLLGAFATTVSAAGNTILTVGSAYNQEITGATTQTVTMPVAATLQAGHTFKIINNSSANVTLNSSGGNLILTMAANTTAFVTCVLNSGTTAASWNSSYVFDNGAGVASITGTANQVIASASTGPVTLSLPQSIATTSSVQFDSVSFSDTTHGISGTTTNNSAAAGYVGEYITSNVPLASATSISNATPTNLTSISLTAGDWDVGGNVYLNASGLVLTVVKFGINTTSATFPDSSFVSQVTSNAMLANQFGMDAPHRRISISGTTTVYIVAQANFGSGSCTQSGTIWARRVR